MSETRIARGLLALTGFTVAVCAILLFGHYTGDALLYLPFARNTAHGDFFASTPGVFSSGSTSPLWPFILAPAFWFDHGEVGAQIIAIVILVVALLHTFRTLKEVSGSALGASVGLIVVAYMLVLPGLLMFESALVVLAVNILVRETFRLCTTPSEETRILIHICCAWGLLLLIRLDTGIILAVNALLVGMVVVSRRGIRGGVRLTWIAVMAVLPAVLFYGYSWSVYGVVSISAYSRALNFREGWQALDGTWYALRSVLYLTSYPCILWCMIASWSWWTHRTHEQLRTFGWFTLSSVVAFLVAVTFVVPVRMSPWRYLLPVAPLIACFTATGVRDAMVKAETRGRRTTVSVSIVALFVALLPLGNLVRHCIIERAQGKSYAIATDASLAEYLNQQAPLRATLLTYESQVKLQLRSDITVLDADGVIDGKVFPFHHDMTAFLRYYTPQYFVLHVVDANAVPPFVGTSVLGDVYRNGTDNIGEVFNRDGMRVTLIGTHSTPDFPESQTWRRLYEIKYE